jgi:hypothetical protein
MAGLNSIQLLAESLGISEARVAILEGTERRVVVMVNGWDGDVVVVAIGDGCYGDDDDDDNVDQLEKLRAHNL